MLRQNTQNCKPTSWIVKDLSSSLDSVEFFWALSSDGNLTSAMRSILGGGMLLGYFEVNDTTGGVVPTVYLKSDIELEGEGTPTNPYTIKTS